MYKVAVIVGTRPEIIKMSETIKIFDKYFQLHLIHTGQNYDVELSKFFFEELEIREPNIYLNTVGNNLGDTLGNIISLSYNALASIKPDALVVLGDTNSALSVLSAKRLKIPVFHIEAGNRCYDENLPEEINRRLIDHISDVNLCYSEHARNHLLEEGLKSEFVFKVGSPLKELYNLYETRISNNNILDVLGVEKNKYIVVSIHREENMEDAEKYKILMSSIDTVAATYKLPIIFTAHPRTRKKLSELNIEFNHDVRIIKPVNFTSYLKLQKNAFCVLSDSGTLAEESTIVGFPAISVRTSSERSEALEKGAISLGHLTYETLEMAINFQTYSYSVFQNKYVEDYNEDDFSIKITNLVMSYIPIINNKIWSKNNRRKP